MPGVRSTDPCRAGHLALVKILSFFFISGFVFSAFANNTNNLDRVDNFVLLDHQGNAFELYYQSDADAVVFMVQSNNCPAADDSVAAYQALRKTYADRNVRFYMLNSSRDDDRTGIKAQAQKLGITLPILDDDTQIIGESLHLATVGEVLVLDTDNWEIAYRGPVSKGAAAVEAVLDGAAVEVPRLRNPGCDLDITRSDSPHRDISYSETIGPILVENCAYCHTEGGIGPWAMTSYNMIRGFAPMIREVVRTKRMPPWHADPHIGSWEGDRSLSVDHARTLVHWIEAGAPRGEGPDPLEQVGPLDNTWPLGEPDLVVDIPGFEVAASGVVDYQFPYVRNELDHGVWITAATLLPGDRSVVHHVLAGAVEGDEPPDREDSVMDNYIIGYAPGAESYIMPEGTGVYLAPGGFFTFQLHYTPTGKVVVDNSKMGLYLSKEPPENFLRHSVVISPAIDIPARTPDHQESAYYEFHQDAIVHTLFPHSHYRGRSSVFEVAYPDGRVETVLSVPNYDFNWQRGYNPVAPLHLPAGSRLIHRTVYDNSAQNPSNPDPDKNIGWGLQSWDEMLYGAFSYSWVDETTQNPIHDKRRSQLTQFFGFADRNMDGKLAWSELPDRMKKRLVQGFSTVDSNGDGGLNLDEFMDIQLQSQRSAGD